MELPLIFEWSAATGSNNLQSNSTDLRSVAILGGSVKLRRFIAVGVSLMLLGASYAAAKYYSPTSSLGSQNRLYRLTIDERTMRGEGAIAEVPVLKAREGDHAELLLTAALPAELYIHGLEVTATVLPNTEASLIFSTERPGRYFVHLHNVICAPPHQSDEAHVEVAVIEVEPR